MDWLPYLGGSSLDNGLVTVFIQIVGSSLDDWLDTVCLQIVGSSQRVGYHIYSDRLLVPVLSIYTLYSPRDFSYQFE